MPATSEGARLLAEAATRAQTYLESLDGRPVFPSAQSLAALSKLDEPLPEISGDTADTLRLLDEIGSPATVASAGPRYFGFVTGGALPAALGASVLANAWDQNAALPAMSPIASHLHGVVRRWLVDLLGLPPGTQVAFVSGATMANVAALAAARDALLARTGWDAQRDGLFGAPPLNVVVGEDAHSTLFKALGLVGVGRARVLRVPTDTEGRMQAARLPRVEGPTLVCAQAGEVNTGAFDPFEDIVEWARERDAWVHVDGAFGLWAAADPGRAHLVCGLSGADSWATDAHKWLNVTYDSGMVFVRDESHLRRTFAASAGYLPAQEGAFEAMHHAPQSSQRARQIEVWAVLRSLGRSGLEQLVRSSCERATELAAGAQRLGLRVLNDVVLNQVLLRAHSEDATLALLRSLQADGICWCGSTRWRDETALRLSVSGWNTTPEDVARTLQAMERCL